MQYPELTCFAIPNGGFRNKVEAAVMKGEGILPGVADLFLMRSSFDYAGLFIEIKTDKGRQTDAQKKFEKNCALEGYGYEVVRSLDEFIQIINEYLKLKT
jgi:hypothetical protein